MRYIILFITLSLFMISCSKDKFTTVPQIEFKSVNTTVLGSQQIITFTLSLTDKEGDVAGAKLYIQKVAPSYCPASGFIDTTNVLPSDLPTSASLQADILVSYSNGGNNPGYSDIAPECNENDTCYFRFVLTDKAGHVSDTLNSPTIVIIK